MSRLIIKNLPKHLTEERFREHFSTKGEVTDAKLMKNSWGKSRGFGFIGFKTEKDAKIALDYLNNTFIDTSKIVVEKAIEIGSDKLPRAWSQYTTGSSAFARKQAAERQKKEAAQQVQREMNKEASEIDMQKKKEQLSKLYKVESDAKLREYLEVMQSRPTAKTWANDDALELNTEKAEQQGKGGVKAKAMVMAVKNRKPGGEGLTVTQTKIKFEDSDDELYDNLPSAAGAKDEEKDEEEMLTLTSLEPVNDELVNNDDVSDLDWLRSRMKPAPEAASEQSKGEDGDVEMDDVKEEAEGTNAEESTTNKPTTAADQPSARPQIISAEEEAEATRAAIADTGRLFVRNLPYTCTEDDLRALFEKYGPLSEIHMPITKDTKKPVGYAFIMYLMPEHAVSAFNALDKRFFMGRLLHIIASKDKPHKEEEDSILGPGGKLLSIKKQKELKRKGQSGMDFNWNTLYMNPDAIAASIADRLNISKADILNPEADNMSVRMAVAETQIIMETKQFLQEEGIDVEAFGGKKRSDTVILVKNIPFSTTEQELTDLFGTYGDLGRVLMPPAKTIAIVEFLQPSEARAAFSHLAYRRFKDSILYLEKAPVGVFTKAYDPSMKDKKKDKEATAASEDKMSSTQLMAATTTADDANDADNVEGSTLFIKNINFKTTGEALRKAFAALPGLKSTVIRQKPDPKNAGKTLSMGFGFAEFATKEQAMSAMRAMNGFILEGNKLEIKFSDRGSTTAKSAGDSKTKKTAPKGHGTKLLVRNIPFEATKKDIMDLFKTFGQLKSVRLPKKMTGEHRGFAFLDFMTKQEAKNVYENVANTHLLGRHLVLEWAEEDSNLDVLREKVGRQFRKDDGNVGKKRRKVDLDADAEDMMMDMDD